MSAPPALPEQLVLYYHAPRDAAVAVMRDGFSGVPFDGGTRVGAPEPEGVRLADRPAPTERAPVVLEVEIPHAHAWRLTLFPRTGPRLALDGARREWLVSAAWLNQVARVRFFTAATDTPTEESQ